MGFCVFPAGMLLKNNLIFFNALAGFLLCGLQLTIGRVAKQVGNYLGNRNSFFGDNERSFGMRTGTHRVKK